MKEMIYEDHRKFPEVLSSGVYKDHHFTVLSLGTHPTAYIESKDNTDPKRYELALEVNGGVTFFDNGYWGDGSEELTWIGWDYCHAWDWAWFISEAENIAYGHMKHTTEEIQTECYHAIDQLIDLEV